MTSSTWQVLAFSTIYEDGANWTSGIIPGASDTAFFGTSNQRNILITASDKVSDWVFNPWAETYKFTISINERISFFGAGIVINGGRVNIDNQYDLDFSNNGSAGSAVITNEHRLAFFDGSNAGSAHITSNGNVEFWGDSSAGNATIDTKAGGLTVFFYSSNGGDARLNTGIGGNVNFSFSAGLANDHVLTVGSIGGAGTYNLGANALTVGLSGLPSTVSGLIEGLGGALVKTGLGTLTLSHAGNTYSGGTTLIKGALELAAVGAAGTGAIAFGPGSHAKLKIENAALSGHVFGNEIDFFGKHDVLDLTGLHFHHGAKAIYQKATDLLTVHSGHVTDKLTLVSPHGTHFTAANDGHGGTKVTLDPRAITAHAVVSLSSHALIGEDWATQIDGSANHTGDFLFVA
jgi:autotransporter-associated beta strand protein